MNPKVKIIILGDTWTIYELKFGFSGFGKTAQEAKTTRLREGKIASELEVEIQDKKLLTNYSTNFVHYISISRFC